MMNVPARGAAFVAEVSSRRAALIAEAEALRRQEAELDGARAAGGVRLAVVDPDRIDDVERLLTALRRLIDFDERRQALAARWRTWQGEVDAFERWGQAQAEALDAVCLEAAVELDPTALVAACESGRRES